MQNLTGFFDLCVNAKALSADYENIIKNLYKHGYRTIAINYVVDEEDIDHTQHDFKKKGKNKRKAQKNDSDISMSPALIPELIETRPIQGCENMKMLHRLTIHFSTKEFYLKIIKLPEYRKFHIIAVLPLNATMFAITCTDVEADILAMKTNQKSDYKIFRKHYNQLLSRGFYFELPYASVIMDESSRRILIVMAHHYQLIGRSRNVIISSGLNTSSQIRSPYDVVNLGLIFGLSQAQSKTAILQNARNLCYRAVSRRYGKIAMLASSLPIEKQIAPQNLDESIETVEIPDDDDEIADVGHQLKKIKT